jgi:hypothetical protein
MGDTSSPPQSMGHPTSSATTASLATRIAVSGVLTLTPVVVALAVPLYQRTGPILIGIPFFYWFQMAMAVVAAVATGTVYRLFFTGEEDGAGS